MVRAMVKKFTFLPPLAYLCVLNGPSGWTSEEKSFFEKISKGDRLTVTFQNVPFEPSRYPTILCASHHNEVDIDVITFTPSRNSLVHVNIPNPSQPVKLHVLFHFFLSSKKKLFIRLYSTKRFLLALKRIELKLFTMICRQVMSNQKIAKLKRFLCRSVPLIASQYPTRNRNRSHHSSPARYYI